MPDLRGEIDIATRQRLCGWVQDRLEPSRPVSILVTLGDTLIARVMADRYRADLEVAGIGDGRHHFEIDLDPRSVPVEGCVLHLRREGDGADLPGSPVRLASPTHFDAATQDSIAALLDTDCDDAELQTRVTFLATQMERLLQQRATRQSLQAERALDHQYRWRKSVPAQASVSVPLRALVIDEIIPVPGRDAGSNAILSHITSLQRLGYRVVFAAASMGDDAGDHLVGLGVEVCHAPWYASVEEVLRRQPGAFDVVYLHRAHIAVSYLTLVRRAVPRARVIYSVADLHHLRLERQAAAEHRPELLSLAQRMRSYELFAAWSADVVVTHSTHEAAVLRQGLQADRVHVVPWAVPLRPVRVPFAKRRGIAFIGGYAHTPNVDAALWLVQAIMPIVWRQDPDIECLLVGSAMPERLRRLARPGVIPLGQVGDLAGIFDRVRLTVAPLAYGAGAKGKVLDSLAAGVPCVATPIAVEGLDLPAALTACVGDDSAGIAAQILRLHGDEAAHDACRDAALQYAGERLSEDRVDDLMRAVLGQPHRPARQVA